MTTLGVKVITSSSADLPCVRALYESAFPENERRPFDELMTVFGSAHILLAFYSDDVFCGFASLLTVEDITHIMYFAILPHLRGAGLGSRALALITAWKPGNRYIADLEAELSDAPNFIQRKRRKAFYLRNGFAVSEASYHWQGESYELVVCGGSLTNADYDAFWRHFGITVKR